MAKLKSVPRPSEDKSRTLGQEVYNSLRADLIAGRLQPGERLPFRQMSQRYGVGIAPLREALSRLASERLVQFEGQRGYAVAQVSLDELRDLCALRIDLSCKALALAIERGDDYWESEILAALHRLERSPFPGSLSDDAASDEWERRHTHFHHSLLAACGSPWLLHFCTVLCDQFQRYRRAVLIEISGSEGLNERVRHQHRKIADAAIARDADQAAAILSKHFQGSVDIVIERYTRLTPTRERKTASKRAETATII